MTELTTWEDLVEEIFDLGSLYDSQRDGSPRSLALDRTRQGVWTAEWTNRLPSDVHWTLRMHGHDKEHALSGLARRMREETGRDSGRSRHIEPSSSAPKPSAATPPASSSRTALVGDRSSRTRKGG